MRIWQKILVAGMAIVLSVVIGGNNNIALAATPCCDDPLVYDGGTACNDPVTSMYVADWKCAFGEHCAAGFCAAGAPAAVSPVSSFDPCLNDATNKCNDCVKDPASPGTWTAIGCLKNKPEELIGQLVGISGGIAGGIAFLLMLAGAAQMVLSQGIPEKIQQAKEIIASAIIGLVFIFLSIMILQLIGVQILGIPGWS